MKVKPITFLLLAVLFLSGCSVPKIQNRVSAFSGDKWYYKQLNETEKAIYEALSAAEDSVEVTVGNIDVTDAEVTAFLQNAVDALLRDKPEVCGLNIGENGMTCALEENGTVIKIDNVFKFDKDTEEARKAVLRSAADNIPIAADENVSLSLARYLTNVEYCAYGDDVDNAYGALVNRKANCLGIAKAFTYLCSVYGGDAITVSGKEGLGRGNLHAWNYVSIGENAVYAIDITYALEHGVSPFFSGTYDIFGDSGRKYTELYLADGDIAQSGKKIFEFPTLSYYCQSNANK